MVQVPIFYQKILRVQRMPTYITNATSSTADTIIWPIWTQQTATISTQAVWSNWVDGTSSATGGPWYVGDTQRAFGQYTPPPRRVLTAEEIARHDAARARQMEEARAVHRRRKEAEERAEQLLLSYLTPAQREEYRCHKRISVQAKSGRLYHVRAQGNLVGNVHEVDAKGEAVARLCAHASHEIPMGDQLLTQMMLLRHHEDDFRRIANRH